MSVDHFHDFAKAVHARYQQLTAEGPVFLTSASKDDFWTWYLEAFPAGTNPVFRERTEHDCACCRSFIKNIGRIVVLDSNGNYQTIWDNIGPEHSFYQQVAEQLRKFILSHPIQTVWYAREARYGMETTYERLEAGNITWHHFFGETPRRLLVSSVGEKQGEANSAYQVLKRALDELSLEAVNTVEDLILSNSIYRGEEHLRAVQAFKQLKVTYAALPTDRRNVFVWQNYQSFVARFKNTAIGTLVEDLSNGLTIERAVASFESKVAPTNYRRTSAPITQGMINKALFTLKEMNLEGAVRRRLARLEDISVRDVLFVDRAVRPVMRDGLADLLRSAVTTGVPSGTQEITGEQFLADVLPGAETVSIIVENRHLNNFVTLTAPEESAERLFSWGNNFAWAYDGDVTDSIRERVKAAGGNVNARLRISLSWNNYDDLDLHCQWPGGSPISFMNKQAILDVDMNAGGGSTREPVENLAFTHLPDGKYVASVHQYALRERTNVGFEIEYAYEGQTLRASYPKLVAQGERIDLITLNVKQGKVIYFAFGSKLQAGSSSTVTTAKWGVTTGQTLPVDVVTLSPNYWGEHPVGNKHVIFALRGCKTPDKIRGFFNEFLRPELVPHRKVFEVLGSKTMCEPTEHQLSGLGFSSTRRDTATFVVRKNGATRTYTVQF
jgi:hypothetical protein